MTTRKHARRLTPFAIVAGLGLLATATILVTILLLSFASGRDRGGAFAASAGAKASPAGTPPPASPRPPLPPSQPRPVEQPPARVAMPPASAVDTRSASDSALMEKLRGLAGQDPEQILRLAREANARDPDGPDAPERAWMVVKSLVDLQRFSEAKDEAQTMVNRYPGTSWAQDIQRHLLSNPL